MVLSLPPIPGGLEIVVSILKGESWLKFKLKGGPTLKGEPKF